MNTLGPKIVADTGFPEAAWLATFSYSSWPGLEWRRCTGGQSAEMVALPTASARLRARSLNPSFKLSIGYPFRPVELKFRTLGTMAISQI